MEFSHRLKFLTVLLNLSVASGSYCLAWNGDCLPDDTDQHDEKTAIIQQPSGRQQDAENPVLDPNSHWNEPVRNAVALKSPSIRITHFVVDFEHLSQLASTDRLTELVLDAGKIDDRGLREIARHCPKLEHLRLRFSPITDSGARSLSKFTHLRILNLPHSKLSSQGIEYLSALPNLELLRLGGSRIDDSAVAAIARLPKLESLHLIDPSITVKSLDFLAESPKLTSFYLDGCQIAGDAWVRLKQKRPDLHVHLDQNHADRQKLPSEN